MDYRLIDADGHYYEADDCFSRHIEPELKDATVRVERRDDSRMRMSKSAHRDTRGHVEVARTLDVEDVNAFAALEHQLGGSIVGRKDLARALRVGRVAIRHAGIEFRLRDGRNHHLRIQDSMAVVGKKRSLAQRET